MSNKLSVTRLAGSLGAEIEGLSLSNLNNDQVETIKDLLHEHLVLFFPQQFLDIEAHVALGKCFGPHSNRAFLPAIAYRKTWASNPANQVIQQNLTFLVAHLNDAAGKVLINKQGFSLSDRMKAYHGMSCRYLRTTMRSSVM